MIVLDKKGSFHLIISKHHPNDPQRAKRIGVTVKTARCHRSLRQNQDGQLVLNVKKKDMGEK